MTRWLLLIGAALGLLLGLDWLTDGGTAPTPAPDVQREQALRRMTTTLPGNYAQTIERLDLEIGFARTRAEAGSDQWLAHQDLAVLLLEGARLSGSYADYSAAAAALDRGFSVAAAGAGPHAVRASLDFGMHRLAAAESQLGAIDRYAVPPYAAERAEYAAMRGDILFYRGDYAGALARYDAADAIEPGAADFRRAIYHAKTGNFDRGEEYFDRVERGNRAPAARFRAFIELQRGILDFDRGRLGDALAHFRRADGLFPGYWLIEEHIAEVTALNGDTAAAEARYRDIVRRTNHPEFMDALATLVAARGDVDQARRWRDRAGAIWRQRLAEFPEASYGHALDHCAARGDRRCALDLARRNHQARPYGDAKVALADALLGNGQTDPALALIETVLASPWRTAELHHVASRVYAAAGNPPAAAAQRRRALAINPRSEQSFRGVRLAP